MSHCIQTFSAGSRWHNGRNPEIAVGVQELPCTARIQESPHMLWIAVLSNWQCLNYKEKTNQNVIWGLNPDGSGFTVQRLSILMTQSFRETNSDHVRQGGKHASQLLFIHSTLWIADLLAFTDRCVNSRRYLSGHALKAHDSAAPVLRLSTFWWGQYLHRWLPGNSVYATLNSIMQ